ncbi:hypothetical protein [Gimesia panareensis]|uniref:hypothetical protein n=1 Tax=Gimesia panareensis TaxID=2527978 RepID=UPI00119EF727|nr:hypothetical protein [Gimesia panareensis]
MLAVLAPDCIRGHPFSLSRKTRKSSGVYSVLQKKNIALCKRERFRNDWQYEIGSGREKLVVSLSAAAGADRRMTLKNFLKRLIMFIFNAAGTALLSMVVFYSDCPVLLKGLCVLGGIFSACWLLTSILGSDKKVHEWFQLFYKNV